MKKTLVTLSLIASTALFGANSDYKYELTPTVGGTITDGSQDLENFLNYGLRFGINLDDAIADQIEIGYERADNVDDDRSGNDNEYDINRYFINAVSMYDTAIENLKWYGLAGLGYEDIDKDGNDDKNVDDSGLFQWGLGLQYFFPNCDFDLSLKTDLRHVVRFDDGDSNLVGSIGLAIPFGKKPVAVVEPTPEPEPQPVEEPKPAPKDSDNDGVFDDADKCPNTPAGVLVDAVGCTTIYNIKINFDTDKANIKPEFQKEIDTAVKIMNQYKGYNGVISGHTDSTASDAYNQKLSERRANQVKDAMIAGGIEASRLSTMGYGESQPIADNNTEEGRYENRRIELTLEK